jgi:arylsulfatase A-like enzyme
MRAASLLLVFLLAKLAILWGHTVPWSGWTPAAYVWQDVAVVLLYAVAVRRGATAVYWALAIYAAINIPVGRAVSSPLTWPMLRAARGPLADSMLLYITWTNFALVLATLAAAALLPSLLRRTPRRWFPVLAAAVLPLAILGPTASAHVDAHGMDRNPVAALIEGALPRSMHGRAGDWRTSRFPGAVAEDLTQFSGIAKGRNVVVVSLESTAAQYLGLYGSGYDVMPNLGTLARNALVFDNAYAVYPESIKGLYSVMCSAYPAFQSQPEQYKKADCRGAALVLRDAGYRTAMFHSGRFAYLGMESIIRNRGFDTLEDAGDIGGNYNSSFGVDERSTVARVLRWLDALPRGQRFYLTYLPVAGHHPYPTPGPGPFAVHDEIDQYRNALHYGDESLGELMRGLRERGLDRDTVWMIYGDHGEAFRQHDGNYGHTFFLYDENVRVPLLIAAPGLLPDPVRSRKVVSLVDAAPTLLDFLGMELPPTYQGHSALDATPRMALFFTDYSLGILGLRDGRWKFTYEMESGRRKLFDLERDPRETADVSAEEATRSAWYAGVVRGWIGK